jgi:HAD superfamily hydrolase (TIGR01509 family)
MIKGAIFDVDGTILDSMYVWEHTGELYLKKIGEKPEAGLDKKLFSMTMKEGAEYLRRAYKLSITPEDIIKGINATVSASYERDIMPKEGVVDFLKDMYNSGVEITVATSTDREHIEAAFKRLQIMKYFSRIYTCSEKGCSKSSPYIFSNIAREMKLNTDEIWVFEDAVYAAKAAKSAGLRVAGIYDIASKDSQEELKEIADIYLRKWISYEEFSTLWV